jgi:RimJ/RimL family protein N-acetyltransferase
MANPILLDLPTSIATTRLLLRPPQAGDGARLFDAVSESLPELRQFLASLPWISVDQTVELSEAYCRQGQANFLGRKDLPFLIFEKATGELVGAVGLHRMAWDTPKVEVGYWGRTSMGRRGYVSEAVMALVDFAFEHIQAMRVELITDEANTPSRRVAERCQFQLEGTLHHERRAPDGSLRNTCIYARFPERVQ